MDSLSVKAVLAGISFGIWPLLMNKSGLGGNISSFVLVVVMFVCVLPFSVGSFGEIFNANTNLIFAIGAAIFGAVGILLLNNILSKTTPQNVCPFFVLMIVAQIAVPAVYHTIMTSGITATKGIGFVFAVIAAILLNL